MRDLNVFSMLGSMTREQLEEFDSLLEQVEFGNGDLIVEQGKKVDGMFFVLEGQVDVYRITQSGGKVFLRTIHSGGQFGEVGLLEPGNRTATVQASSPCKLLKLSGANLGKLMQRPSIAAPFFHGLCRSLAIRVTGVSAQYAELVNSVSV